MVKKTLVSTILIISFLQTVVLGIDIVPEGWREVNVFVETTPKPIPDKIDILSGFIPYTRNYIDLIYTNSHPRKDEITETFHITLARGEYEPFVVALYGLKDLDDISLTIQDVKNRNENIPISQFEIRKIENRAVLQKGRRKGEKVYKLIPSLLKLKSFGDLRKEMTTAFWITAHTLVKNTPGKYSGKIIISRNETILRELKIEITVLPFILEEIPERLFAILYTPSGVGPEMERRSRILLKDMRDHGMNSYSPLIFAWGEPLASEYFSKPKFINLVNHLQWAKEEGFWQPSIVNINKLIRTGQPKWDANYTKFDKNIDIPNLKKLVKFLEEKREKHEWPEILYLPIDEPGSFTDKAGTKREEIAVLVLKTLKELNVRGVTTIADLVDNKHRKLPRWKNVVGWWKKMRPYCSVRIYLNGFPEGKTSLPNEIKDANSRGHKVMLYENTSTMGIDPRVSRMYYGFYGWRINVKGITSWTHPTLGNATVSHAWINRAEIKKNKKAFFKDNNWELPPSTRNWEMVREGIDDAKYVNLFQKLLEQNRYVNKKYTKLIKELKTAVDATKMSLKKPKCNWNGKRFSNFKERLAQAIIDML